MVGYQVEYTTKYKDLTFAIRNAKKLTLGESANVLLTAVNTEIELAKPGKRNRSERGLVDTGRGKNSFHSIFPETTDDNYAIQNVKASQYTGITPSGSELQGATGIQAGINEAYVASNVSYMLYLEEGTVKFDARHYFRKALANTIRFFKTGLLTQKYVRFFLNEQRRSKEVSKKQIIK